ncbi:hypothetical protein JCGZ_01740 [Jatropha curcas]|uniref:Uncharacterized protein n=1 Tax=Jatropha curcas TaxID=180498 RepID=A0A067JJL5_JATCU|nr:hypothetical protein JCGZ_01740 [Jatropha curcas]
MTSAAGPPPPLVIKGPQSPRRRKFLLHPEHQLHHLTDQAAWHLEIIQKKTQVNIKSVMNPFCERFISHYLINVLGRKIQAIHILQGDLPKSYSAVRCIVGNAVITSLMSSGGRSKRSTFSRETSRKATVPSSV